MGLFSGRSKKHPTTTQSPPPPYFSNSQLNLQEQYQQTEFPPQQRWTSFEERPNISHGDSSLYQGGWSPASRPILVTQNNYIFPQPQTSYKHSAAISRLNISSATNALAGDVPSCIPGSRIFNDGIPARQFQGTPHFDQGTALYELISSQLDNIITLIDGERFGKDEGELALYSLPRTGWQQEQDLAYTHRDLFKGNSKGTANNCLSTAAVRTDYFAKANLYANSKLIPNLPPMNLYIETFPLLNLAARYSEQVYTKPTGNEREAHVDAGWRGGIKHMIIKSEPMDDMNTIVFAIRGTQTFMDWAVNLHTVPISPDGFLDDPGNLCHAGFLNAAKKMVKPVAARLRQLLQEDPSRSKCSLLITGHSAGGAVAALLYSHMLSITPEAKSELNELMGFFRRVHCISFGAPPVSLLPLSKPDRPSLRKFLFLSFINEGDPVVRAEKPYVRSLLDLYSLPAPGHSNLDSLVPQNPQPVLSNLGGKSSSSLNVHKLGGKLSSSLAISKTHSTSKNSASASPPGYPPFWPVPVATLSNAGTLVLLRTVEREERESRPNRKKGVWERMNDGIVVQKVSDDLLRDVVWGDPVCHMMGLYKRRIEILATNAVLGRV